VSVADAGVAAMLGARRYVDVTEYERLVRAGEGGGEPPPGFTGDFVFAGVRDARRRYGRAVALAA